MRVAFFPETFKRIIRPWSARKQPSNQQPFRAHTRPRIHGTANADTALKRKHSQIYKGRGDRSSPTPPPLPSAYVRSGPAAKRTTASTRGMRAAPATTAASRRAAAGAGAGNRCPGLAANIPSFPGPTALSRRPRIPAGAQPRSRTRRGCRWRRCFGCQADPVSCAWKREGGVGRRSERGGDQ
jgi:hypothetical protein